MRVSAHVPRVVCALVVVVVPAAGACDDAWLNRRDPPVIDLDDPLVGDGEGEGSTAGGEGEGEAPIPPATFCADVTDGHFGAPHALVTPRSRHTATLLPDGRVLVVGGEDAQYASTSSTEFFDPTTQTFVAGPPLQQARYEHAAVALPDGRVAVAGGFATDGGHLASIEVLDAAGTSWTSAPPLSIARAGLSAFAMPDGRVIVFGGDNTESLPSQIEAYDSASNTTSTLSIALREGHRLHAAAQLHDGSVLVVGGFFTSAIATSERIAADLTSVQVVPDVPGARRLASITALPDGRALVIGGFDRAPLSDIKAYDPTTNAWSPVGALFVPRTAHEAALVGCAVVVCGGLGVDNAALGSCEAISVDAGTFGAAGSIASLPAPAFSFSMTSVQKGGAASMLVVGGSVDEALDSDGHADTGVVWE